MTPQPEDELREIEIIRLPRPMQADPPPPRPYALQVGLSLAYAACVTFGLALALGIVTPMHANLSTIARCLPIRRPSIGSQGHGAEPPDASVMSREHTATGSRDIVCERPVKRHALIPSSTTPWRREIITEWMP